MSAEENLRQAEVRYEHAGNALRSVIEELAASDEETERELAKGLREAPERVKFLNLPAGSGVGMEAFYHPIISFDARNWDRGYEIAELERFPITLVHIHKI